MRNEGVWAELGQSLGLMFSQHTHGSSCQTSDAPKGSLRRTYPISLPKFDQWVRMRGQQVEAPCSTWCPKAMAKEGHGRQRWILMMGNSRWCWPYVMVHGIGGLVVGSLCVGLVAWVQGKAPWQKKVMVGKDGLWWCAATGGVDPIWWCMTLVA